MLTKGQNERFTADSFVLQTGWRLAMIEAALVTVIANCTRPSAALPLTPSLADAPSISSIESSPLPPVRAQIAFLRKNDVFVLDATSGVELRVTDDGRNSSPWWGSDGRTLFFTKQADG